MGISGQSARRIRRSSAGFRMEPVESRLLMTINSWAVAGGGDWDVPTNWSLHHVPLASEDVVIGGAGAAVTFDMGKSDSLHSIISTRPLTLSSGTLSVATTVQVSSVFTLAGATLSGATVINGSGGQGLTVTGGTLNNTAINTSLTIVAQDSVTLTGKFSVTGALVDKSARIIVSGKGDSLTLPVTSLDGTSLEANNGAVISLPDLSTYSITSSQGGFTPTLGADGTGSELNMPNLTTVNGGTVGGQGVHFEVSSGATVSAPKLTNISQGRAQFQANNAGSVLNLSALASLIGSDSSGFGTNIHVSNGAHILTPKLQQISLALIEVDNVGSEVGTSSLTNINNGSIQVTSGASLTLSTITSWSVTDSRAGFTPFIEASSTGSLLSLPNLTSINGGSAAGQGMHIFSSSGAHLLLSKLATITGGGAQIQADGAGTTIDISSLTALIGEHNGFQSVLQASNGGAILSPKLQKAQLVVINVYNPGSSINTSVLSNIDNSSIALTDGATFTLADVTTYTLSSTVGGFTPSFNVQNAGSVLSLPALTTIVGGTVSGAGLRIWALESGHILLTKLAAIHGAASLKAVNSGSLLNVSALKSFTFPNNGFASGEFEVSGGVIET